MEPTQVIGIGSKVVAAIEFVVDGIEKLSNGSIVYKGLVRNEKGELIGYVSIPLNNIQEVVS